MNQLVLLLKNYNVVGVRNIHSDRSMLPYSTPFAESTRDTPGKADAIPPPTASSTLFDVATASTSISMSPSPSPSPARNVAEGTVWLADAMAGTAGVVSNADTDAGADAEATELIPCDEESVVRRR